jgi:hypothetical protein
MKWRKITLNDDVVARGAINIVTVAFEDVMPPGDESKTCALFSRHEPHATAIFVSPQFAKIAPKLVEKFNGIECEAPPPKRQGQEFDTALLLAAHGDQAWSLLG